LTAERSLATNIPFDAPAATDQKPKLRYPADPTAGRVSVLRGVAPTRAFDKSIRKLTRMPV
jgi:hypothetical protein